MSSSLRIDSIPRLLLFYSVFNVSFLEERSLEDTTGDFSP